MSYQKCPICNGTGSIATLHYLECPTCKGKRIISTFDGKPPTENIFKDVEKSSNFEDLNKLIQGEIL